MRELSRLHVLVTGALGFIGSNVCSELVQMGHKVTGLDHGVRHSIKQIDPRVLDASRVSWKYCDISMEAELSKVLDSIEQPVDGIFHFAGLNPGRFDEISAFFKNNFTATLNILAMANKLGIRKIVLGSTISVYGVGANQHVPEYLPVDESHVTRPYDFYDISKYQAEQICKFYHDRFDIGISILRISKTFGPGLQDGFVRKAADMALSNSPITVEGQVSTDFVYVTDVAKASLAAFEKPDGHQIFNIGSGEELTWYQLCSRIIGLAGSSSKIIYHDKPKARFSLDISKAKHHLAYTPTEIEEGLRKYINYLRHSKN